MERKDAINALVTAVEEMDYGAVLSFRDIGDIIGHRYGERGYNDVLQAARKRLVAAGHMIVNMRGIGYKVLNPDDYTGEGVRMMRQGARRSTGRSPEISSPTCTTGSRSSWGSAGCLTLWEA